MFDPAEVREILIGAARAGNVLTYSQMLGLLGYRFTRPKMRTLCKVLDSIDQDGRVAGEPDLAVLVVRQSDGLPGQGWFVARSHLAETMKGHGRSTGKARKRRPMSNCTKNRLSISGRRVSTRVPSHPLPPPFRPDRDPER